MNNSSECDLSVSGKDAEVFIYTDFNRIFVILVVPIITAFGVFTNGVFLFTLYRVREMRTVTNFFLANLAIADGCLLLCSSFQWIISFKNSPLDVGMAFRTSIGCALPNYLVYVFYFASIFLVSVVIVERYAAICHPMMY